MKKAMLVLGVFAAVGLFVFAISSTSFAQMPGAGSIGRSVDKASKGDVSGAASEVVSGIADAENNECKGRVDPFHQNVQYSVKNDGPGKIQGAFGPCKVSDQSDTYWSAKCDYKKFNYIQTSCNTTNCSVYCYKK